MNFNKRVNGSWTDIPHYIMGTDTDTITILPADLYADGTNATVDLVGNMSQSGTPTSTTPITPSECGERTGNLISKDMLSNDTTLDSNTGLPQLGYGRVGTENPIDVSAYTDIALSYNSDGVLFMYSLFSGSTFLGRITGKKSGVSFDVSNADKMYICFYKSENISKSALSNIMLNTGSQPLPYEPYGYKIPILSNNTATPVYLGEVETTRQIKKLVLTGTSADGNTNVTAQGVIYITPTTTLKSVGAAYCTHFKYVNQGQGSGMPNNSFTTSGGAGTSLWFKTNYTSVADFKSYLAQQYANGTPVTVWYVLATEETGIVNEPLRKIGDYADEVSGITIPTTAGANTIDVDTTLKPSEVSVNYHGWHPVLAVHERENGAWT